MKDALFILDRASNPFIVAWDKFVYMEIIPVPGLIEPDAAIAKTKTNKVVDKLNRETLKLIVTSINDLADENGWAFLGDVGNLLMKNNPISIRIVMDFRNWRH
jgi:hypothetical protein